MRRLKAWEMIKKREAMKAKGLDLLKVLQSEITHELSSPCFQNDPSGSPGDFTLEWDAPHSQDVVLRNKCNKGEEVVVSAIIGKETPFQGIYPRLAMMKVCIKKPGLSSLLQFDCECYNSAHTGLDFSINSVRYLPSTSFTGRTYYTSGQIFRDLDAHLQAAFRDYLKARGVGDNLINFLLRHLHKKEETQYVNWLQKLKEMVTPRESKLAAKSSEKNRKKISSQGD